MESLHHDPDIKSMLFFGAAPSIQLIADKLKDFCTLMQWLIFTLKA